MQGGFGSFSTLPSVAMLQKKVLWFWPWNPVLHQRELGVFALGRGIDISYFNNQNDLNVASPLTESWWNYSVTSISYVNISQFYLIDATQLWILLPFVLQLSDTPNQDRSHNLLNALNSHKDR